MPVDLATLSSWLKSEEINVDLESKLLLREAAVMEPATALTASQNYRGGRGGGWQGAAAATVETAEAASAAVGRAVVRRTMVSSTAVTTACTPSAEADSHLPAAGRALTSRIVQLVKSVRKQDTPLFVASFDMRRAEIVITVPIMHLKPALPLNGCWILGPTCTLLLIYPSLTLQIHIMAPMVLLLATVSPLIFLTLARVPLKPPPLSFT